VAHAESRISIAGFVDRTSIEPGSAIDITVVVGNTGDTTAQNCSIEIVPTFLKCNSEAFTLASKAERAVNCRIAAPGEGFWNLVAVVRWEEQDSGKPGYWRAAVQPISEITVTQPGWRRRPEIGGYAALTVGLLAIAGLLWLLSRPPSKRKRRFKHIKGAAIVISFAVLTSGIILNNGTIVVSGLTVLLIYAFLVVLGRGPTKRLLSRVQKAGPLEFSVAVHVESMAVVAARGRAFRKASTRLDDALARGDALGHYVDLYRLKMYLIESKLIPNNPRLPGAGVRREDWFGGLSATTTSLLGAGEIDELKELYRIVRGYEEFKNLFDQSVRPLLRQARDDKTNRRTHVGHAKTHVEDFAARRDFALPPNCLVLRAALELTLGAREAAFGTLYQTQDQFPANFVSNSALCYYLMDLADDSYTALRYGDKALAALRKLEKELFDSTERCVEIRNLATRVAFAERLKDLLEPYVVNKNKELKDWLTKVRHGVSNNVAYVIANSVSIDRENDARSYAKESFEANPNNDYLDTWALVRLNFGIANRDRKEVKAARKLFTRIAREWESSGGKYERRLGRLRLKASSAAVKSADHWD